jgi:hypothetical protein
MHDRESGSWPARPASFSSIAAWQPSRDRMCVGERAARSRIAQNGLAALNVNFSRIELDVRKSLVRAGAGQSAECPTPTS